MISAFDTPSLLHNGRSDNISDLELARCFWWQHARSTTRVCGGAPMIQGATAAMGTSIYDYNGKFPSVHIIMT